MKPIISESVYKILKKLISKFKAPGVKSLNDELLKAEVVKDEALEDKVVSLGSTVEYTDEYANKPIRMQIVLPEQADLSKRKISIFAPISVALIGFKESDIFKWRMPSGIKTLKILKVVNAN